MMLGHLQSYLGNQISFNGPLLYIFHRHMILPIKSDSSDARHANLYLLLLLHSAMLQENKIALAYINQEDDERPHFGFLHTSNHSTDKEKQSLVSFHH